MNRAAEGYSSPLGHRKIPPQDVQVKLLIPSRSRPHTNGDSRPSKPTGSVSARSMVDVALAGSVRL